MNIFHRVTLQSLRKNKTRTIVTIIGITLSTALICAVVISLASMMNYAQQYIISTNGKWHGRAEGLNYETFDNIKDDEEIAEYTAIKEIGYAEIGSQNKYKPYLFVVSLVGENDRMLAIDITSGKYPETKDEILLPEHLHTNGGVKYSIGDKLELDIGYRFSDGQKLHQNNPNYIRHYVYDGYKEEMVDDELTSEITRNYTVCGFYKRPEFEPYNSAGYTAIVLDDGYSNDTEYQLFFTMKKPKDVYNFLNNHEVNGNENYELLAFMGIMPEFDGINAMIKSVEAILIFLIMFASVALIYNAFAISVSERTKQFGLLSSIGATRKQSRQMVFFEAFVVSAIGIPAGIAVGIVGIGITLSAISDKINSITGFNIPMKIYIYPLPIITACAIGLVTVMISAFIPSIRATKITAVEAIRQNKDIKSKNKPLKTPKFIYKIFGISGMLAQKYFKRSRKKYRSTIMSLFMSIVLFISASAFCEYLLATVNTPFGSDVRYDIQYHYTSYERNDTNYKKLFDIFQSDENIKDVAYLNSYGATSEISKAYVTDKFINIHGTEEDKDIISNIYTNISFVDDDSFRKFLKENNLDEEKFMNPDNPIAVALDENTVFDIESQKYIKQYVFNEDEFDITGYHVRQFEGYYLDGYNNENGKELYIYRNSDNDENVKTLTRDEATEKITLKVGKVITEKPYWYTYGGFYPCIIYPYSFIEKIFPDGLDTSIQYYMTSDNHSQSYENISKILEENSFSKLELYDYSAETEKEQNMVTIIKVFAYGFIIIISLIACANVFNTISTNVNLRRREFAMLRSIGMTNKELRRMMNYECLMYGTKSLVFGLPVSFGMTYLIHIALYKGFENNFFIPWDAVGIAVLSVFAVVFATMLYSMSKIKSDNLIETLKNENL